VDFDKVYSENYPYVYRFVLSLCRNEAIAEDVTSEAFFKALKSIGSYKGDCEIKVWICQIAKNTYFTQRKGERLTQPIEVELLDEHADVEGAFADKTEALEIHRILHKLGEPYKEVFSLRLFGELSFAEIAELFSKTESWARVTYHRAKAKIREELK
jgi:RNA polymerase sigma-70 factor (ECF subfamily)